MDPNPRRNVSPTSSIMSTAKTAKSTKAEKAKAEPKKPDMTERNVIIMTDLVMGFLTTQKIKNAEDLWTSFIKEHLRVKTITPKSEKPDPSEIKQCAYMVNAGKGAPKEHQCKFHAKAGSSFCLKHETMKQVTVVRCAYQVKDTKGSGTHSCRNYAKHEDGFCERHHKIMEGKPQKESKKEDKAESSDEEKEAKAGSSEEVEDE